MNKGCLILDVAHGQNVSGKRSPDLVFEEWQWSRDRVNDVYRALIDFSLPFDVYAPFLGFRDEPGLWKRVSVYNERSEPYKHSVMLSLHVDAFKGEWWNGTGFSFFTNRLEDLSDELAEVMAQVWEEELPEERIRRNRPKDVSKDKNFTVIWGYNSKSQKKFIPTKYNGILIENLFMDNKKDVYDKLMNDDWNRKLVDTYILAILKAFEYLGYMVTL